MSSNDISQIMEKLDALDEKLKPIAELYRDITGVIRVVKWVFGILVALGGAVLLIRSLFETPQ